MDSLLKEKMTEREKRLEEEMNSMAEETEELRKQLTKLRGGETADPTVAKDDKVCLAHSLRPLKLTSSTGTCATNCAQQPR